MNNRPTVSTTVVVVGVVVVFCFTLACAAAMFIAAPDGANTGSLITILLGPLAPTIATLALLVKQGGVEAKVDQVAADTYRLTNGLLDSKIRAGLGDTIDPALLREDAHDLIAQDRAVRDGVHDDPDVSSRQPRQP